MYVCTVLYEMPFVDNVDHLFLGCPHCPHGHAAKMRGAVGAVSVDTVDHLDRQFKSLYPICIYKPLLILVIFQGSDK